MIANESPVRAIRTLGSASGGVKAVKVGIEVPARSRKPLATTTLPPTFDRRDSPRFCSGRAMLPQRWYTERAVGELLRLLDHLGGAQGVLLGGGVAWVLFELRSQKARAKEDREAADRRFREFGESIRVLLREYNEKNDAEHARLFGLVDEVKTKVEVLLDRSKRPESGGSAD